MVWRDGRVAEGGGLLNRCTVKSRTGGSNPPLSATSHRTKENPSQSRIGAPENSVLTHAAWITLASARARVYKPSGGREATRSGIAIPSMPRWPARHYIYRRWPESRARGISTGSPNPPLPFQ
jgi:hypothetical protein